MTGMWFNTLALPLPLQNNLVYHLFYNISPHINVIIPNSFTIWIEFLHTALIFSHHSIWVFPSKHFEQKCIVNLFHFRSILKHLSSNSTMLVLDCCSYAVWAEVTLYIKCYVSGGFIKLGILKVLGVKNTKLTSMDIDEKIIVVHRQDLLDAFAWFFA